MLLSVGTEGEQDVSMLSPKKSGWGSCRPCPPEPSAAAGDFCTEDGRMITDIMVEEGHAVAYFGGSKDEIQLKHMANREKLLREGVVVL